MMETAEMMYWETKPFEYIRPIYKTVPFDGTRYEGASLEADLKAWKDRRDAAAARAASAAAGGGAATAGGGGAAGGGGGAAGGGGGAAGGGGRAGGGGGGGGRAQDPNAPPRANNGLSGNPHFATKEIGKDLAEIGINNTVNQVKRLLAGGK